MIISLALIIHKVYVVMCVLAKLMAICKGLKPEKIKCKQAEQTTWEL